MSANLYLLFHDIKKLCPILFHNGISEQLKINDILNKWATSLFIYKSDIYISGYYSFEKKLKCGYWKNSVWNEIPTFSEYTYPTSIYVENDNVYIGGYELKHDTNGGSKSYACYWKNKDFFRLNPYIDNVRSVSNVVSIFTKDNDIYCTGRVNINNKWHAGYWKNQNWISLTDKEGITEEIKIIAKDIYIIGQLGNQIGYWKNGQWNGSNFQRLPYLNKSFYVDEIGVHQLLTKYTNSIQTPYVLCDNKIDSLPLIISDNQISNEAYTSNIVKVNNDVYIGGYCRHPISGEFIWIYWLNNQLHKIDIIGSINLNDSFFIGVSNL